MDSKTNRSKFKGVCGKMIYTEADLLAFGESELIQEVLRLQEENKTLIAERGDLK
jgi:hypothetical protein